jgi:hypothetical protein
MVIEYINLFRRIMATICCIFGLPGNILTIIVCMKALCQRTLNFERKVFDLYLAEISILGKWECFIDYRINFLFYKHYDNWYTEKFKKLKLKLKWLCYFF